jgi:hypothetical protein
MEQATLKDWTETQVLLKYDHSRDVKYRVYRVGDRVYLDVRELDGTPVHTLEMPDGMKLARSSYEVMLRYVLLDVVAA